MRFGIQSVLKWFRLAWRGSGEGRQLTTTSTVELPGDRFTDRLRAVLLAANDEAHRLRHDYVGTEHLLLSLTSVGSGVNANALKKVVGDVGRIRSALNQFLISGLEISVANGPLPLTPRAAKAIAFAKEEAQRLQSAVVDAEHLLLGLLRDTKGVPFKVFLCLGVNPEAMRSELLVDLSASGKEN